METHTPPSNRVAPLASGDGHDVTEQDFDWDYAPAPHGGHQIAPEFDASGLGTPNPSKLGWAGVACGIIGIFFAAGIIFGIIAMVLGSKAAKQGEPHGPATAAKILGAIACFGLLFLLLL